MHTCSGGWIAAARLGQPLSDLQPVDAMHPGEMLGDGAGLVALQGADEMPFEPEAGQRLDLRQPLPAHSFRRKPTARPPPLREPLRGHGLADRQQGISSAGVSRPIAPLRRYALLTACKLAEIVVIMP
jgi:hypothetical protein